MKKWICLGVAAIFAASTLSGCGSTASGEQSDIQGSQPGVTSTAETAGGHVYENIETGPVDASRFDNNLVLNSSRYETGKEPPLLMPVPSSIAEMSEMGYKVTVATGSSYESDTYTDNESIANSSVDATSDECADIIIAPLGDTSFEMHDPVTGDRYLSGQIINGTDAEMTAQEAIEKNLFYFEYRSDSSLAALMQVPDGYDKRFDTRELDVVLEILGNPSSIVLWGFDSTMDYLFYTLVYEYESGVVAGTFYIQASAHLMHELHYFTTESWPQYLVMLEDEHGDITVIS